LSAKQPSLSSRTRVLGVIGDPIEHSLSPLLHNFVLERLGLDCRYLAFRVAREHAADIGRAFRTLGLTGLNVTIPHKETVLPQMEALTEEARLVGAVNTIGRDSQGRLCGHNTDVAGFLGALRLRGLEESLAGCAAVVLGAGGAARAVLCALGRAGAGSLTLVNRTVARAEELNRWLAPLFPALTVSIVSPEDREALAGALAGSRITVNVTPLGMAPETGCSPLPGGVLPPAGSVVYDTIYNPGRTLLLQQTEAAGCVAVGGLDMLIIQGMESLCWWLGEDLPWRGMLEDLRRTLREALGEG
jgi:shikimate dehydrogenase